MRKVSLFFMVVLVGVLLAACGGGSSDQPAAAAADTQPAAAQPAAQQPAAQPVAAAAGDAKAGEKIFLQTCIACHGQNAEGVKGLGKNLKTSTFIAGLDDTQMVEFLKKGRDTSDKLNTTGVAMPPKGGNPALNDQDLANVVAYLRSIHQQ